eukprot:Opistho-1_new@35718
MARASFALACLLLAGVAIAVPIPSVGDSASDEITSLPGLTNKLAFRQYAGYVSVDDAHGRNLFYWFTEAETNPATAPLVLWLNGGPGCSSVSGFFTENGPFLVQSDGATIALNDHAWNKVANVLWLESPAGVGFSYSDTRSDYNTNDLLTAQDAYRFLQNWLERFPQYRNSPFFITGESYAGHYIPNLAKQILDANANGTEKVINLKGFAAGNALTNEPDDFNAPMTFFYTHALISPQDYKAAFDACKGDFTSSDATCQDLVNKATQTVGDIDNYGIYEDICTAGKVRGHTQASLLRAKYFASRRQSANLKEMPYTPPCIDDYVQTYINRADVKTAIHAKTSISWSQCTGSINYDFNHGSMLPLYPQFFDAKLRVLIYSGDTDGVLPTVGTEGWLARLPITVTKAWQPWTGSDGQVAGYVTYYDKLTFLTIKGAGHMVPEFRPIHALDFLTKFLNGTPY